jgi:hypothetical protein
MPGTPDLQANKTADSNALWLPPEARQTIPAGIQPMRGNRLGERTIGTFQKGVRRCTRSSWRWNLERLSIFAVVGGVI